MSRFLRFFGVQSKHNVNNYKRFQTLPKTDCAQILYRGDTRTPDVIKQGGGFFPQKGKANVAETGGSTAMVCLTLSPSVGATYYSIRKYFNSKNPGLPNGVHVHGYVYAVFLPTGLGIKNYEMAKAHGSSNLGSQEISTLAIPWKQVYGWRQLKKADDCKCNNPEYHFVPWHGDFVLNPDFKGDIRGISVECRETLSEYVSAEDVLVWNSRYL
jgi:hypothetical protein